MSQGLTQRAYAERIGVSEAYVSKLVRLGKLTRNKHRRIDPEVADRELAQVRDPSHDKQRKSTLPGLEKDQVDFRAFSKARTDKEVASARLKELELEVEAGRLVEKQEVGATLFALARMTRDTILRVPDRLAPQLAVTRSQKEIKKLLHRELHLALDQLTQAELERVLR